MDDVANINEEVADDEDSFDWDEFLAEEAELQANGYEPVFNSADYPTEEAAAEALDRFLNNLYEEVLRELAAVTRVDSACA